MKADLWANNCLGFKMSVFKRVGEYDGLSELVRPIMSKTRPIQRISWAVQTKRAEVEKIKAKRGVDAKVGYQTLTQFSFRTLFKM